MFTFSSINHSTVRDITYGGGVQRDASERMRTMVSSQILNRGSGCENGGENDGDNGGEITGGENDGLERIDGNRLRNRL